MNPAERPRTPDVVRASERGPKLTPEQALEQVLGYLNFSSGTADPRVLVALNRLYEFVNDPRPPPSPHPLATWRRVLDAISARRETLTRESAAFQDTAQAAAVLELMIATVDAYIQFHRDVLFHQSEEFLIGPFFLGRVCEAILRQGGPWTEKDRIVRQAIATLNDHLGYRPVASLESQKIEPYAHEWIRPVPIFVRGAGVAVGRYHDVTVLALQLLEQTDERVLRSAHFDPRLLDELALDPRAYDFDHPVNKRPNYHFGQWDPQLIDSQGRYRRFIVQQVTFDALLSRLETEQRIPRDELHVEAAAVLAGTILMASGFSGSGPDTHDSTVTLESLLPKIAGYRDVFYEGLLGHAPQAAGGDAACGNPPPTHAPVPAEGSVPTVARITGAHGDRLRAEMAERRQPFGAARQHLNAELARRRASQLEHVHLARVFARMGYPEAAMRHVDFVPVASARLMCQIECLLTEGERALGHRDVCRAAEIPGEIMVLMRRGIQCGAIVDPWNILGFDANFSLFPALENSIRDHRVDDLVELIEAICAYWSRVWSEAAAADEGTLALRVEAEFRELATWWHRFAAHEVSSVRCPNTMDLWQAARRVAEALNLWHKAGAAAGDVRFWAPHVEMFDSPQAYSLVVQALLHRRDFVAAMGLLIHWLGNADRVPLEQGEVSFHDLSEDWIVALLESVAEESVPASGARDALASPAWPLIQKLFDYLEANAGEFWQVPTFGLNSSHRASPDEHRDDAADGSEPDGDDADDDESDDLLGAAYEDVVYKDSTDDGFEGSVFDSDLNPRDEFMTESERVSERLAFLRMVARMWRYVGVHLAATPNGSTRDAADARRPLAGTTYRWAEQCVANCRDLVALLDDVQSHRLPVPEGNYESMVEYDRQRVAKETLQERVLATLLETTDAGRLLQADPLAAPAPRLVADHASQEDALAIEIVRAAFAGSPDGVRQRWPEFLEMLRGQAILYVPLAKVGKPREILAVRARQRMIQNLLVCLPRLGLIAETVQLIETVRHMERERPAGAGSVTEFDELFAIGYRAIVEHLIASAWDWEEAGGDPSAEPTELITTLERVTESLLVIWLEHSRTLRLSVLEQVYESRAWGRLVEFVQRYGADLFTQKFLNFYNLHAILHHGVDAWLRQLQADERREVGHQLVQALADEQISRTEAVRQLAIVLEAIVENIAEYRDYNSTTTQSDHGDQLFSLLDFLRLRSRYDRVCWNLKPVVLSHEILVRAERDGVAERWRRTLSERIGQEAEQYVEQLGGLQAKHAMRIPTVADRLAERFLKPLLVDRLCALVGPALEEARGEAERRPAFEALLAETDEFIREPTGVGLDPPAWIVALEDEVQRLCVPEHRREDRFDFSHLIPLRVLSPEEIQNQLEPFPGADEPEIRPPATGP